MNSILGLLAAFQITLAADQASALSPNSAYQVRLAIQSSDLIFQVQMAEKTLLCLRRNKKGKVLIYAGKVKHPKWFERVLGRQILRLRQRWWAAKGDSRTRLRKRVQRLLLKQGAFDQACALFNTSSFSSASWSGSNSSLGSSVSSNQNSST